MSVREIGKRIVQEQTTGQTSAQTTVIAQRWRFIAWLAVGCISFTVACAAEPEGDPALTEVWEPEPRLVTPGVGTAPPSDAIVLFDGTSLAEWVDKNGEPAHWPIADGAMTSAPIDKDFSGAISTRRVFGDVQLHLEWRSPVDDDDEGQDRGNSGVFFQELYEVQVLDSYQNRTYSNGQAASIYKQHIPLVNATRPPGEWQSYDIVFRAPRFAADGSLTRPAVVTVLHNGVLVQDHVELRGPTVWIGEPEYEAHAEKLPLVLQDHTDAVSYRNIWVRELE